MLTCLLQRVTYIPPNTHPCFSLFRLVLVYNVFFFPCIIYFRAAERVGARGAEFASNAS